MLPPVIPNCISQLAIQKQSGGNLEFIPPLASSSIVDDAQDIGDCAACDCAHDRQGGDNQVTCYIKSELMTIASRSGIKDTKGKSEQWLIEKIRDTKENECGRNDQSCWAGQDIAMLEAAYKPVVPNGQYTWLNTTNIQHVMDQFSKIHTDFQYIGTVPMDFEKVSMDFKNFNLKNLMNNNKKKFGAVFNTDYSTGVGQHWIAMYGDLDKKEINFFDSYGTQRKTPQEIDAFAERLQVEAAELSTPMKLNYSKNNTVFQKESSECGIFSLYFLKKSLEGVAFSDFQNNPISDQEVNTYRKHKGWMSFFRNRKVPVGEL